MSWPSAEEAGKAANELEVEPLETEGVRGGRIVFSLAGTPEEVVEMLLDFDGAAGKRPWAKSYETLSSEGDEVRARWTFEGKLGMNPSVVLAFETREEGDEIVVEYRVVEPAFGLAAFFGDYRIRPLPGEKGHSLLAERVFIDSGIALANASAEDIAAGLREDAKKMREWMLERAVR